ncbi:MAG: PspC domain-containing protein [Aerococcus sp.]|nr:PspC domain-containing protein [Aerococcus sp.]
MKQFTRSSTNRVFAGVCGGLGEYFHIDPRIIRLIFLLLLVTHLNLLIVTLYFLAAVFVPRGESPLEAEFRNFYERQADWMNKAKDKSQTIFQNQRKGGHPTNLREAEHVDDEEE